MEQRNIEESVWKKQEIQFILRLLVEVQLHPALYEEDGLEKYGRDQYKMSWEEVSRELGTPAEICEEKWRKVLENYKPEDYEDKPQLPSSKHLDKILNVLQLNTSRRSSTDDAESNCEISFSTIDNEPNNPNEKHLLHDSSEEPNKASETSPEYMFGKMTFKTETSKETNDSIYLQSNINRRLSSDEAESDNETEYAIVEHESSDSNEKLLFVDCWKQPKRYKKKEKECAREYMFRKMSFKENASETRHHSNILQSDISPRLSPDVVESLSIDNVSSEPNEKQLTVQTWKQPKVYTDFTPTDGYMFGKMTLKNETPKKSYKRKRKDTKTSSRKPKAQGDNLIKSQSKPEVTSIELANDSSDDDVVLLNAQTIEEIVISSSEDSNDSLTKKQNRLDVVETISPYNTNSEKSNELDKSEINRTEDMPESLSLRLSEESQNAPVFYIASKTDNNTVTITPYIIKDFNEHSENVVSSEQNGLAAHPSSPNESSNVNVNTVSENVSRDTNQKQGDINVFFDNLAEYLTNKYSLEKQIEIRSKICSVVSSVLLEEKKHNL